MVCKQCGSEVDAFSKFCAACGAPVQTDAPERQPGMPADPITAGTVFTGGPVPEVTQPVRPDKAPRRRWAMIIPIAAILIVAVTASAMFLLGSSPEGKVDKAVKGLYEEIAVRLGGSPLKVAGVLADCLNDGEVSVDVTYRDYWDDTYGVSATLMSNGKDKDFAVNGVLSYGGIEIDAELYLNKERIAVHSSILGEDYYGFQYNTFPQEIESFGDLIGLNDTAKDQLIELVAALSDMLNSTGAGQGYDAYSKLLSQFISDLKPATSKVDAMVGGKEVTCTAVEYVITENMLVGLLNNVYTQLEQDKSMRGQFEVAQALGSYDYDEIMDELRSGIRMLENDVEAEFKLTFLIDNGGRLKSLTVNAEVEEDGDSGAVDVVFDFGATVHDTWTVQITGKGEMDMGSRVEISWDYTDESDRYENAFQATVGSEMVVFGTIWEKESGAFTLSARNDYLDLNISGALKIGTNEFEFMLDEIGTGYETYSFRVSGKTGARVEDPSFVSIGLLDESFLYMLQTAIYTLYYQ